MERITNGKVPYIKAFAKSYGDRWGRGGYGQVKVSEIPNIHSYDDFKAYYDSVVPYSRGQYKGLKPFGRRGGHYHMKEDSFGIHVMYFISTSLLQQYRYGSTMKFGYVILTILIQTSKHT